MIKNVKSVDILAAEMSTDVTQVGIALFPSF